MKIQIKSPLPRQGRNVEHRSFSSYRKSNIQNVYYGVQQNKIVLSKRTKEGLGKSQKYTCHFKYPNGNFL